MITSPFDLDRTLREATHRLVRARRALAEQSEWDEAPPNPLARFRAVLGKDTFEEVQTIPDSLIVPALRAHLAKLTLARVLWDDEVRIARAWAEPTVGLEDSVRMPRLPKLPWIAANGDLVAPRTLLAAVLVDRDDARRRGVAEALARAARERLRDPVRFHADRRARAAAQLGASLDAIDLPAPASAIEAAASELLDATAPMHERFAPWEQGLSRAMAHDAANGWPAHLSPRWVLSIFGGTDLLRGLRIEDVALPAVLGPASFARGLAAFGEAFGHAAGPTSVPFVLARPAVDLRPLRIGALMGSLAGDDVFARRALALGQGAAREHARSFARAACAHGRLMAAAVRTRASLLPPRDDLDDRFSEETARAWGDPLPPTLAGVLPRIAEDTPARFTATLLAALDRARLIETLDEDWYLNPRSAEALRALADEPSPELTPELLQRGAVELARTLVAAAD